MSIQKNKKNFPGRDGFTWWTGIVEGRKDPLKCGRVQIRMFGWHTDNKKMVPSDELLWAQPIMAANAYDRTCVPKEGEVLFGFYMDGEDAQFPFYMGVIPNIPEKLYPENVGFSDPGETLKERPVKISKRTLVDGEGLEHENDEGKRYPDELNQPTTSKLARNEFTQNTAIGFISNNIVKNISTAGGKKWDETRLSYNSEYPYNSSIQSESGHFLDIDDTKGRERISTVHRTGTMEEMRPNGSWHKKVIKHLISLVHGSDVSDIRGNLWKTVERWTRFKSNGRTVVDINADAKTRIAGSYNMEVGGDFVLKVKGRIYIQAEGGGIPPLGAGCGEADFVEMSPSVSNIYFTPYITAPIVNTLDVDSDIEVLPPIPFNSIPYTNTEESPVVEVNESCESS